jgi:hypothetical protein
MGELKITGPIIFEKTKKIFLWLSMVTPDIFFMNFTVKNKVSGYFVQKNALAHTTNLLVLALDKVFGELQIVAS